MHLGYGMAGAHWVLPLGILVVIPLWQICKKAGYSGWLGLLGLVPVANLLLLYFLGFSQWPARRVAPAEPGA